VRVCVCVYLWKGGAGGVGIQRGVVYWNGEGGVLRMALGVVVVRHGHTHMGHGTLVRVMSHIRGSWQIQIQTCQQVQGGCTSRAHINESWNI